MKDFATISRARPDAWVGRSNKTKQTSFIVG
jgi:hypothetical protein